MCKITVIPKVTDDNRANVAKMMKKISQLMCLTENDGFGYAAYSPTTGIFGERWVDPKQRWEPKEQTANVEALKAYGEALICTDAYNSFGEFNTDFTCIMLHSRKATSTVNIANTHPFTTDTTALVHNGVITNHVEIKGRIKGGYSTCDSEAIVLSYEDNMVPDGLEFVDEFANELEGWFACAAITGSSSGQYYLDVFKDDRANLWAAYVKEIGVVFSTDIDDVLAACKALKFTVVAKCKFNNDYFVRHDAATGEVLTVIEMGVKYKNTYNWNTQQRSAWEDTTYDHKPCYEYKAQVKNFPLIPSIKGDKDDNGKD